MILKTATFLLALFLGSEPTWALSFDEITTGEFIELEDESLKTCFEFKDIKVTSSKDSPKIGKMYLIEIAKKDTVQLGVIAMAAKLEIGSTIKKRSLKPIGGLTYESKNKSKKTGNVKKDFVQVFVDCEG